MKGRIAIKLACILAAALAASAGAQAQGPGDGGPRFIGHTPPMERAMGPMGNHGRWWNDPVVVDKLKLTDQQRKDMDAIMQDHREKLIDLRANVEKAEVAMQPMIQADQPNEAAILAQIDKIAQARAELEKGNARFLLALRAKLTPDQWKALQDLRAERRDGRMWRRGGPGAGPGPAGNAPAPPPANPPQQ
jgi:protein CpxP